MGPKKSKNNQVQIFRFSSFRLWPFYPTGINMLLLKHAEKQSDTTRAKSGASAAKPHASRGLHAKNGVQNVPGQLKVNSPAPAIA